MARKIKFALEMADGAKVRGSLEELREHFDLESAVRYFLSGKLTEWLDDRYYEKEAEALEAIEKDAPDLNKRLCEALGVEYEAEEDLDVAALERLNEKKSVLRQRTDDEEIIKNADKAALTQEDLADLLDMSEDVIYLCGEEFTVPARVKNKKYIGILGMPKVTINATSQEELDAKGIVFENVTLPWGNAAVTQTAEVDMTAQTVIAADEAVPLDELKDLYKSSFAEYLDNFRYIKDKIWEVHKRKRELILTSFMTVSKPVKEDVREMQKKMAIRLICKNQSIDNDLVHVCIMEDLTSGWALTKNSFCFYIKGKFEGIIIPYKDIASVDFSETLCLKTFQVTNISL